MTTVTENQLLAFTDEGFQAFLDSRNEPAWLTEIRKSAWQRFQEMSWPSNKDEEWMRTDIRMFHLDKFNIPSKRDSSATSNPVLAEGVELVGSSSAIDGVPAQSTIDDELVKKGVVFGNISELLEEHGELIQKHLFQTVSGTIDRFAALHQATWTSGTFLYVPRNVCISKPIHTFTTVSDGGSDFTHTLIVVEEGAEATVLAETRTCNGRLVHLDQDLRKSTSMLPFVVSGQTAKSTA
jgi:Fe-S cluster assembly protein SufD